MGTNSLMSRGPRVERRARPAEDKSAMHPTAVLQSQDSLKLKRARDVMLDLSLAFDNKIVQNASCCIVPGN